jgi:hypothetical protein
MVNAVASAVPEEVAPSRVPFHNDLPSLAALISPAVLIGVLHTWSMATAPRYGMYFTAAAWLVLYALLAIVRGVHVAVHSYDGRGRYDAAQAGEARRSFYRALFGSWKRIATVVLPLLFAALALDLLTADTGLQHRANVHLSVLFVQMMAWWRYGPVIVVAASQWAPPRPLGLARARLLAMDPTVRAGASLLLANLVLAAAAAAAFVLQSKWMMPHMFEAVPSARFVFVSAAAACALLTWLSLLLTCRSAFVISLRLHSRRVLRRKLRHRWQQAA